MKQDIKKKIISIIPKVLFVLTPLISATLFCLKDGHFINEVYMPLGGWSDEITYYKEIEGILSYGLPRGYFGYNQSRALYGSLNVWGIVPLIPYILFGFFFGWNYVSPIYANILFGVLVFFFALCMLRLNKMQMGMISMFWLFNQFMNRYVLSGVVEASIFAQLLVVTVCGEYLLSERIRNNSGRIFSYRKDSIVMAVSIMQICMLTLARPYFAVLFLIPLWKAWQDKWRSMVVALPFIAVGTIVIFFINNHYFCSAYFSNVLSFDSIIQGGVDGFFATLISGGINILKLIWYAIRYHDNLGWNYLLLMLELLVMLMVCLYRTWKKQKLPILFVTTLIGNILILVALIEMYSMGVGARHILALVMCNVFILAIELSVIYPMLLTCVCVMSLLLTNDNDKIPYKDAEYAQYMESLEMVFADAIEVSEEISFDNLIAMPTADKSLQDSTKTVCTYYGLLFAMPAGVGISLDFEDYYEDVDNLKAGYILVHPEGKIRLKLEAAGMYCVYQNHELALYKR